MPSAGGPTKSALQSLLTQLDEIERGPGGGVITFPGGRAPSAVEGRLEVSNLRKPFWPKLKLTKGDLFRHYGRRIYVDYIQNVLGKTLASAYSARASEFAGVSTPLTWDEVEEGVSPCDFTIANFDQRIKEAGDIWAGLRKAKGADLRALRAHIKK